VLPCRGDVVGIDAVDLGDLLLAANEQRLRWLAVGVDRDGNRGGRARW
jgi:hypothetical protein